MTQDVLDILRDVKDCTTLKLGSYAYDCKSCDGYDSVCMEGSFNGGHVPVIMAIFQGDTIVCAEEGSGDLPIPFGWVEMVTMARDAYLAIKNEGGVR